jgi:hypothetical protein
LRHEGVYILHPHALLYGALHAYETNSELVLNQLAYGAFADAWRACRGLLDLPPAHAGDDDWLVENVADPALVVCRPADLEERVRIGAAAAGVLAALPAGSPRVATRAAMDAYLG